MGKTSIEWTDRSVNPIRLGRGHFCQKISPGCANCYASRFQPRVGNEPFGGTSSTIPLVTLTEAGSRDDRLWLDESKLQEVLSRRTPTKWFWCDMTDLFGDWVPEEWIDKCFAVMALTPEHTHQVLTKRPERMLAYMRAIQDDDKDMQRWQNAADELVTNCAMVEDCEWPLSNVWLGTSVEDQQRADERIPHLLKTPAAVRFLSCEPLLGLLNLSKLNFTDGKGSWNSLTGQFTLPAKGMNGHSDFEVETTDDRLPRLNWVIVGGESGPGARPMDIAWARSILQQCKAAGVACFTKQLGAIPYDSTCEDAGDREKFDGSCGHAMGAVDGKHYLRLDDRKGGDPDEWPADLRVREFPEAVPCE